MNITMSMTDLRALLIEAGEVSSNKVLSKAGLLKPNLSKQEAYKMYGASFVERWIKEGLIHPERDGSGTSKWRIDRSEIEAVSKASNRHTFLNTDERKANQS